MINETDMAALRMQLADRLRRRKPGGNKAVAAGEEPRPRSVLVCGAGGCASGGGRQLYAALRDELLRRGLAGQVELVPTGCLGLCAEGPVLAIAPEGVVYSRVGVADVWEIVEDHLLAGKPVERLLAGYIAPEEGLYSAETRRITARWGIINPERLEEAVAAGSYRALAAAVLRKESVELVRLAGEFLPGFGPADGVVATLNEPAPGVYLRSTLAESDPHSLLEGLALAAIAVNAPLAVLHVPAEYTLAAERLRLALRAAVEAGFLGDGLFGGEASLRVELCVGEEDFLQKDDSALLEALGGRRAAPAPADPIDPAASGCGVLGGLRVRIASPESLVRLAFAASSRLAAAEEPSAEEETVLLALSGRLLRPRLCEASASMTLRELIEQMGGGLPEGDELQAVQFGGPTGGLLRPDQLEVPLNAAGLRAWREGMGAPVLTAIGGDESLLDALRSVYRYLGRHSCGQCSVCRIGLARVEERLGAAGEEPDAEAVRQLAELGKQLREASRCGFGRSAARPLLTYLAHFCGVEVE